jgi:hypothetical protein
VDGGRIVYVGEDVIDIATRKEIASMLASAGRLRAAAPVLFAGAVLAGLIASASAQTSTPPHVGWAERLVAEVAPADNFYGSHPTIVHWAEGGLRARNRSVCSSFVTHVFERAYGLRDPDIRRWFGHGNPQAIDYEQAIAAQRGFARVARVADLRAGDLIAFSEGPGHHPTGHVMIADGQARPHSATQPDEPGMVQYEIAVIDSSHSGHGSLDTRFADGGHVTGVGRGTLRLYANADGSVAGYTWSTKRISQFYPASARPLVFGRYTGVPANAAPATSDLGSDDASTGEQ